MEDYVHLGRKLIWSKTTRTPGGRVVAAAARGDHAPESRWIRVRQPTGTEWRQRAIQAVRRGGRRKCPHLEMAT